MRGFSQALSNGDQTQAHVYAGWTGAASMPYLDSDGNPQQMPLDPVNAYYLPDYPIVGRDGKYYSQGEWQSWMLLMLAQTFMAKFFPPVPAPPAGAAYFVESEFFSWSEGVG